MLKKFIITLIVYIAILFVSYQLIFGDLPYEARTVSDTLFYVGLPIFFISLLSITNAGNLFIFVGYSLKSIFTKSYRTPYHEYHRHRMSKSISVIPVYLFILSIICIIISVILAEQVMS
ncbi:MAG: hypothetical protein CVV61_00455 [Tenericutes bacterium HGW-Tenericutes-6]|jgi:hypothetical protein|nr:MAG: hypothetical protein CVV61_00455 [Tenericutes bacterium HGW-Tenericutes-6]